MNQNFTLIHLLSWCKSWNAELDACDGLAHEHLYALLGMKIPFIVNKDFINAQSYAANKFNSIMKRDLNNDHTKQIVWEIDDDDQGIYGKALFLIRILASRTIFHRLN